MKRALNLFNSLCGCLLVCLTVIYARAADLDPVDWWQRDRMPASYLALERIADRQELDLDLSFAPVDTSDTARSIKLSYSDVENAGDEIALRMVGNFLDFNVVDSNKQSLHPRAYREDGADLIWWGGARALDDYRRFSGDQPVNDMKWLARVYLGASFYWGDFSGDWAVLAEHLDNEHGTLTVLDHKLPWQNDLTRFYDGGKAWGDLAGDISTANLQYRKDWFRAWLGRRFLLWGQGEWGRTLISTYSGPLDGLGTDFWVGPAHLGWVIAILDPSLQKYISMHRLSLRPFNSWEIAVGESVVWAQRGIDLGYFNPAIPYYVVQWNRGDVDNLQVSFDSCWHPWQDFALYGELLIDDWQYHPVEGAPDKIATVAGLRWHDPLGIAPTRLGLEYARVNRWTYTHQIYRNRYVHEDMPLGHPLGNDGDRLILTFDRWMDFPCGGTALPGLIVSYTRTGDNNLIIPWIKGEKGRGIPFPTPPVEKEVAAFTKLEFYRMWNFLGGFGRVGWRSYVNHARMSGETTHGLEVSVGFDAGL